jgi:tRNA (mo5U34)-methyltransferase
MMDELNNLSNDGPGKGVEDVCLSHIPTTSPEGLGACALSGMGIGPSPKLSVREHLEALAAEGLVEFPTTTPDEMRLVMTEAFHSRRDEMLRQDRRRDLSAAQAVAARMAEAAAPPHERGTDALAKRIAAVPYWYHKIELPGGIVTPGWAPLCAERYAVPADLTGKRVLDIGAWDGYWTFEALKRGAAEVVAIDDFSDDCGAPERVKRNGWETFDLCREALGFTREVSRDRDWVNERTRQRLRRQHDSVYDIDPVLYGPFDVVFCFGVLYHLKHPLLALEKIAAVCDGDLYLESAVCDDYSPYRGGLHHGFSQHEMVMEFYPGAQLAANRGNWWSPTIECLASMVQAVGFEQVAGWALTDTPRDHTECRGFVSASKRPDGPPPGRPAEVTPPAPAAGPQRRAAKVVGLMSVGRLMFSDNVTSLFKAFAQLGIEVQMVQGVFWGQCLERGLQRLIDGGADLVVTIDHDTLFTREDLTALLRLANAHPEAAAIIPVQSKRQQGQPLLTIRGRSGELQSQVDTRLFAGDVTPIASGHFGLTVLRIEHLLQLPHPWFCGRPNADGLWAEGRIDDDIWFWRLLEKHQRTALLANRVVVGHLELLGTWPGRRGEPIYQMPEAFFRSGRPEGVWQ